MAIVLLGCGSEPRASSEDAGAQQHSQLSVLTYNVAGLPEGISASHPEANTPLISPLLNDYELVLLQEDFYYHPQLVAAADHPYQSRVAATQSGFGDGLTVLSVFPFDDVYREAWQDCNGTFEAGSDCLTPKGFALARVELREGSSVDVYDLHADTGLLPADKAARALNFQQLARAIAQRSAGRAVIVAGDFNERYTTEGGTLESFLAETGLTDVWVELEQGGRIPSAEPSSACSTEVTNLQCERIDKILYRKSRNVALTPTAYQVDAAKFSDAQGMPLSDHPPVSAVFDVATAPVGADSQ